MKKLPLDKILQSQGFGSRKSCQQLIKSGAVCIDGQIIQDFKYSVIPQNLEFSVFNQHFLYREKVYIALNKPQGYECSHQPQHHHSVFTLFPDYLVARHLQAVGRLDYDTTGLLLFSDDGQFIHRLTHPRRHLGKYYQMTTEQPISTDQLQQLAQGVALHQEQELFQAHEIQQLDSRCLQFCIYQGVYHQVKRMMAAVGNPIQSLHRTQIARLTLQDLQLATGEWCYLSEQQLQLLNA